MSEMTPEPTSQDLQLAPPPAPAAALPQTSPNFARRLTAAIVAAVILATGAGVGTGWALARVISSRYPTQVHVQTVQPIQQSTSSGSTNLDINAIGNALGLGGAPRVTKGSVTALDQTITASDNGAQAEQLTGMIQSDAEISPGDSGGALVNSAGQVVGVITAGEAQGFRSSSTTIAFAIPSSKAVDIANRILAGQAGNGVFIGPVGYLGVSVQTLDASSAAQLGVNVSSGAYVRTVVAGSPADHAGITAGSVITRVNSAVVDSATALGDALHQYKPGDQVKITWISGNATHTSTVTLISGPTI